METISVPYTMNIGWGIVRLSGIDKYDAIILVIQSMKLQVLFAF